MGTIICIALLICIFLFCDVMQCLCIFQDQYEQLATHTQKGLEFCEKYGHFIKERCAIEIEYAAKLK